MVSRYTVTVIYKINKNAHWKKQDMIKKISNSMSWNLEYDYYLIKHFFGINK